MEVCAFEQNLFFRENLMVLITNSITMKENNIIEKYHRISITEYFCQTQQKCFLPSLILVTSKKRTKTSIYLHYCNKRGTFGERKRAREREKE